MPLYDRVRNQPQADDPRVSWALVLLLMACVEWVLMVTLPRILPVGVPRLIEAWVDALLLLLVLAPVLWWLLLRPLQRVAREREDFLRDLFSTIENERRATARDLHDGVGQGLTLLVARLKSLDETMSPGELVRRLTELNGLAQSTLAETRRLAQGLRPSLLDDLGLVPAIERTLSQLPTSGFPRFTSDLRALRGVRLPDTIESTLFRIFQESLQNILRHAAARSVEVRLLREPHSVVLEVVDDGRGFSTATAGNEPASAGCHMGLVGMSERASLAGGRLTIESAPGVGTTIEVELPVDWGDDVADPRHVGR